MKLESQSFPFRLLTASFCGGAEGRQQDAEMRVPSIRGHLRDWHRQLVGVPRADIVWGSTDDNTGHSSKIAVTVDKPDNTVASCRARLFPQVEFTAADERRLSRLRRADPGRNELAQKLKKSENAAPALPKDTSFVLSLTRLPECNAPEWEAAQRAVKLWLLVGALGLRSSRAAGSVWPLNPPEPAWVPQTEQQLADTLSQIGFDPSQVRLMDAVPGDDEDKLRECASNTVEDRTYFGGVNPRDPSPVRFKVTRLNSQPRLLVVVSKTVLRDRVRSKYSSLPPFITAAHARLSGKPLGQRQWLPLPPPNVTS
ncbi:MAG: RAMP superfamily CRISPR-associated protein [Verrucomicrobiota bacterium]